MFSCVNYTTSSKSKGRQKRAQASPCWQHLRRPSETARLPSHPPHTPRHTPARHVLCQPTPRWPRRCCSEHGPELQRNAAALGRLTTARARSRNPRAAACRTWYDPMPAGARCNTGLTRANRLWRRIQHQWATTRPASPRWRTTNRATSHSSRRPATTSVPHLCDAARHGRQYGQPANIRRDTWLTQ